MEFILKKKKENGFYNRHMFQWNKIITVDTDHIVGETKVTEQKDETGSKLYS